MAVLRNPDPRQENPEVQGIPDGPRKQGKSRKNVENTKEKLE